MHVLFAIAQESGGSEASRLVLPEIDELIFALAAFLVFFAILAKVAFPALRKALNAREQAIKGELEKAEQARLDAEELMEQYRLQLADARSQADRVVRDAQTTAEDVRRDIVARAEEEARGIIEKARAEAAQERDRAFSEMRRQLADISLTAASRVVERELSDPDAQRQLVDQFIANVGSLGGNGGRQ
jgi:F-type H+-transporting ATPase subunit b